MEERTGMERRLEEKTGKVGERKERGGRRNKTLLFLR